uniref:RCC1 and BTB domain-containing protein 2 n=2 Tax=Lygus hesperus TaxID=30085 RepID=A0A146M702_LYGHE
MKSLSLKRWRILQHLTDDELANIKCLQVYGGCDRSPDDGLSALYVTYGDEVFGTGLNSMIGEDTTTLTFDEKDSQGKSVKVEALSGLGITKIVVGEFVGAALTNKGEVYTWGYFGEPQVVKVKDEEIVMFESYVAGRVCKFSCSYGRSNYTSQKLIGNTSISECKGCGKYKTYTTTSPPPPQTTVNRFFKFSESVLCPECNEPTSSKQLNGNNFHFCTKCNKMVEVPPSSTVKNMLLRKSKLELDAPQKLGISALRKIDNIYCGSSFLVIEASSPNRLFLWGTIDGLKYHCCVTNPDSASFKTISCGGSHLAAVASSGELYTCGLGNKGQLGYQWSADMGYMTLRKVPLSGSVVKVCCGYSSTACLMSNGSIMCFGSNMQKLSSGLISLGCSDSDFIEAPANIMESIRFVDISCAPLTNVFCAKTVDSIVVLWGADQGPHHKLLFAASELTCALTDLPFTYKDTSQSMIQKQQLLLHSNFQDYGTLYGNKLYSDLTLTLADGNFPVHCVVLLMNSNYFKEILSDRKFAAEVLDLSVYNPKSYKSLLKYFYQLPLEDLNCEDLFDLYSIAMSYKEKNLVDATFNKLKAMINEDTVLELVTKAKSTKAEEVLKECELFLSSPQLKNELMSFVSEDIEKTMALLRIKKGE